MIRFRTLIFLGAILSNTVFAGVILSVPDALSRLFPKSATIEEKRFFLKKEQVEKAKTLAGPGVEIDIGILTSYRGFEGGKLLGTAYLDTHTVRTLSEAVLITINPDGTIREIDILRFDEPPEYMASLKWLEQFKGRKLEDALSLKGDLHGITGASLTSKSLTVSVRRILALHQVLNEAPK